MRVTCVHTKFFGRRRRQQFAVPAACRAHLTLCEPALGARQRTTFALKNAACVLSVSQPNKTPLLHTSSSHIGPEPPFLRVIISAAAAVVVVVDYKQMPSDFGLICIEPL